MGKQSKRRKRALGRAYLALRSIVAETERYYNDTKLTRIFNIAKDSIDKKHNR